MVRWMEGQGHAVIPYLRSITQYRPLELDQMSMTSTVPGTNCAQLTGVALSANCDVINGLRPTRPPDGG